MVAETGGSSLLPWVRQIVQELRQLREATASALITDLYKTTLGPQGRLCLATATPVHTSDQTAKTTIFYTPYVGNLLPFYDVLSARWRVAAADELSLALDSNSGHTGYHQSGKNFCLWADYNAGAPRLVSGPAWTSDTGRAAAGEVLRQNGLWVNNASMTVRFGTGAGDTATIGPSLATYLGTFRASADGQTELTIAPAPAAGGTNNKLYLWNAYNRRPFRPLCRDSTDMWSLANATLQAMNNSTSNRISFVMGLLEDACCGSLVHAGIVGSGYITTGVGFDTTASISGRSGFHNLIANAVPIFGDYATPCLGFHYFQAIESHQNGTAANATMFGDSGVANVQTGLAAELWM